MYHDNSLDGSPRRAPAVAEFGPNGSYNHGEGNNKPKNLKQVAAGAATYLKEHNRETKGYMGFVAAVIFIYYFCSDGDFSFLLTLSSLISCASFFMLAMYQETTRSCVGISAKMMQCYLILQVCRLVAVVPFDGYLPFDRTGDWIYQTVEAFIFLLAGSVVYTCKFRYNSSYADQNDTFNHYYLIGAAVVLGLLLHPSLNDFAPSDICWAVALYLESVASLPQLFMFQREGQVHKWTAHFLAAQATSKVISFLFWASSFGELHNHSVAKNSANPLKGYVGYWVLTVQGFQLLVMGDFTWSYYKCLATGVPINHMLSEV